MTKKPTKRTAKQPAKRRAPFLSADDSSPIVVGCSSTGTNFHVPLRIQRMLTPSSLYIRHKTFSNGLGGVQVTNRSLKVYNVGSTGYAYNENSPIDQGWVLNINTNAGAVTITSDDNVTVSISTNLTFDIVSVGLYMYLIFPTGTAIQSAQLNGTDLWAQHQKYPVEIDFYLPPAGHSKRAR
jgi:hypothetical protein